MIAMAILFLMATTAGSPTLEDRARKAMAHDLKDAASAQFQNVREVPSKSSSYICGEVNAKNGFGGYTGFVDFVVTGDSAIIAADQDPTIRETEQELIDHLCTPK